MKKTLVVNLLAGPGAGKSTMAADVYARLKHKKIECEIATEFAKELTWEKRFETLKNQVYIFGHQYHRIFRILGQVDVIVTDSPLLFTPIYAPKMKTLAKLAFEESAKLNSLNVFLIRKKEYNPNGRNQTKEEAIEIDDKIKSLLEMKKIPYITTSGNLKGVKMVTDTIIKRINENKQ